MLTFRYLLEITGIGGRQVFRREYFETESTTQARIVLTMAVANVMNRKRLPLKLIKGSLFMYDFTDDGWRMVATLKEPIPTETVEDILNG